jgi:ComF family protein
LADLIWPPRSLLTDRPAARPGLIEPEHWSRLRFLGPPLCVQCGWPFETPAAEDARCPACLADPPVFDAARAAIAYDDAARKLVLDLKRGGRTDGLPVFGAWMRQAAGALLSDAELIIPTPLHWTRLATRKFNQALWLAEAMVGPKDPRLARTALIWRKRRKSQEGLSASQRKANVSGAYIASQTMKGRIDGKAVLVVDDVYTTGATLEACARALKRAGAAKVSAVTLARVVRPVDPAI